MSKLDVTNIASLEALNSALSQYRAASDDPFHRFAPIFSEKLELLAQLKMHFEEKIRQAERELSSAQYALSACMSNPENICSLEASRVRQAEAALAQAKANLVTYNSVMSQLRGSFGDYKGAASHYENNLQNISSSIVPNFTQLIGKMRLYSDDKNAISSGGVEAGNPVNYTGGVSNAPHGAPLGGIGVDGTSADGTTTNNAGGTEAEQAKNVDNAQNNATSSTETSSNNNPQTESTPSVSTATVGTVGGGVMLTALIAGGVVLMKGKPNDTASVKFLQEQLKYLGYDVDVNGEYDSKTIKAVENFQKTNKISEDGKAGKKVWEKLEEKNNSKGLPLGTVNKDGFIEGGGIIKHQINTLEVENLKDVHAVVIHRTENNNLSEAINAFSDKKRVGTHFIIDKDGTIYQTASLNKTTQHVGNIMAKCEEVGEYDLEKKYSRRIDKNCTKLEKEEIAKATAGTKGWGEVFSNMLSDHEKNKEYPYRNPKNTDSVGIEFIGKFDKNTGKFESVTKEQAESGRKLVEYIQKKYKDSDLYAHDDIAPKTKNEGADVLRAMGYIWDKEGWKLPSLN